jgi:TetR/AcrR family transcriptional repressor of bet genes
MPKKVDHDARRVELAAAALAVIEREGMEGVTVRRVAAEAGWSRGVVEHYFDTREDLLLFVYRVGLGRTRDAWSPRNGHSPLEGLHDWLIATLPLDGPSALNHAIYLGFAGSAAHRPRLARAVEAEGEELNQITATLLTRCVDEGLLAPPFPTDLAVDVLATFVDGLGLNVVMSPGRYTSDHVRHALRAFLEAWMV